MPAWLLWLCPVPLATVAAIGWTAWSARHRPAPAAADTVAAHQRFRQALAAPPRSEAGEQEPEARLP